MGKDKLYLSINDAITKTTHYYLKKHSGWKYAGTGYDSKTNRLYLKDHYVWLVQCWLLMHNPIIQSKKELISMLKRREAEYLAIQLGPNPNASTRHDLSMVRLKLKQAEEYLATNEEYYFEKREVVIEGKNTYHNALKWGREEITAEYSKDTIEGRINPDNIVNNIMTIMPAKTVAQAESMGYVPTSLIMKHAKQFKLMDYVPGDLVKELE